MNIRERLTELRDDMADVPSTTMSIALRDRWVARLDAILADWPEPTGDWRDQIPWNALPPEINWVAYSPIMGYWWGSRHEPVLSECEEDYIEDIHGGEYILDCVTMPTPPSWQDSKVKRQETDDE